MTFDLPTFLSETYPDRVWSLPIGGSIADINWLDDLEPPDTFQDDLEAYSSVLEQRESILADKDFLNKTDYIVTKIAEAQVLGMDIQPLLTEYSDKLQLREQARARIQELEANG